MLPIRTGTTRPSLCCSEPQLRAPRNVVPIRNEIIGGRGLEGEIQERCQGPLGFETQPTGSSKTASQPELLTGDPPQSRGLRTVGEAAFEAFVSRADTTRERSEKSRDAADGAFPGTEDDSMTGRRRWTRGQDAAFLPASAGPRPATLPQAGLKPDPGALKSLPSGGFGGGLMSG